MISVKFKDNHIVIKGHALYDDYGKDIVCASVSSIVITSVNAIIKFDASAIKYEVSEGYIDITLIKRSYETDIIIENMIEMLKDLEKKYNKNIKIYEEVQ